MTGKASFRSGAGFSSERREPLEAHMSPYPMVCYDALVRLWWSARLGGTTWRSLRSSEIRRNGRATTAGSAGAAPSTPEGSSTDSQTQLRARWTATRGRGTGAATSARSALISRLAQRRPSARELPPNHREQPPASRSVLVRETRAHCCPDDAQWVRNETVGHVNIDGKRVPVSGYIERCNLCGAEYAVPVG